MKIKETYVSFIGKINVGKLAFFIDVNKDGSNIDVDSLVEQSQNHNRIVLKNNPLAQKDEIYSYIKKLIKINPYAVIEIDCYGLIKPSNITTYKNVIYNVNVRLKNSNIIYEKRYNKNILTWFGDAESNFLFYVEDEDCLDEVNMIVRDIGIKKHKVFLIMKDEATTENLNFLIKNAKTKGYNFSIDFKQTFWPNEGRF